LKGRISYEWPEEIGGTNNRVIGFEADTVKVVVAEAEKALINLTVCRSAKKLLFLVKFSII
jgi:hypothetical protein